MTHNKSISIWRKIGDRLAGRFASLIGQESSVEDRNDAIFRSTFAGSDDERSEKRVLARHRAHIPALLSYGLAGNPEKTEVSNLNERGLFVFSSSRPAHGSSIEVELVLPPELTSYGKRRVRYHATVVRVEPQPSGQRFGIAAAIKRCEVLKEQAAAAGKS